MGCFRFYVNELLRLSNSSDKLFLEVRVDEDFKSQLRWWRYAMHFLRNGLEIPSSLGAGVPPRRALVADSDAAGGSGSDGRKGVGAVLGKAFVAMRWPKVLRSAKECPSCGVSWKFKMSMMELVGWTLVITCFPREIMNRVSQDTSVLSGNNDCDWKAVVVQIDNEGTISHVRKGYDAKCAVTSALLRATYEVSRGLNADAYARKVSRCSARGPVSSQSSNNGVGRNNNVACQGHGGPAVKGVGDGVSSAVDRSGRGGVENQEGAAALEVLAGAPKCGQQPGEDDTEAHEKGGGPRALVDDG